MKKISKARKSTTFVGYYWWIFRIPTFIHFAKPYLTGLYSSPYKMPYNHLHSNNFYIDNSNHILGNDSFYN